MRARTSHLATARHAIAATAIVLAPALAVAQPTAAGAPPAGSTVIDFNALVAGTPITSQFAALGVTVSGGACAFAPGDGFATPNVGNASDPLTGGQCPGSSNAPLSFLYPALTFTFSSPIQYFGLNASVNYNRVGAPGGLLEDILVLTTGNGSIDLITTTFAGSPAPRFVAIQDLTPFTTVTVSTGGNGYLQLDNVTFAAAAVSAVPEPTTWALLGSGLLSLGGVAARQKRRAA